MGSDELSEVEEDAVWIESDGIVMRKTRRQVPPKINTAHGVGSTASSTRRTIVEKQRSSFWNAGREVQTKWVHRDSGSINLFFIYFACSIPKEVENDSSLN
jgi:hypothetical protein